MGGIYIHIPFCRKACIYCDFHFSTNLSRKSLLLEKIGEEIKHRKKEILALASLQTLYLGGGTPSVLEANEVSDLIEQIRNLIPFESNIEITLEANPDDLNLAYLKELLRVGVNRLSIGVQSFSEDILTWMNRSHNAKQAEQVFQDVKKAGFHNFSADLIFGNPGSNKRMWEYDLNTLLEIRPPHISIYALTAEERTVLGKHVERGKISLSSDEAYEDQFLYAHQILTHAGYEHYELSNYALPDFRSRHNSSYWEGIPYVGLGPSAHSYDGTKRSWNFANNTRYIKALEQGVTAVEEEEVLTPTDRYHEYLMTHFRKAGGVDRKLIMETWDNNWNERFSDTISAYKSEEMMYEQGDMLALTPKGWLLSDQIIREFFIDQLF